MDKEKEVKKLKNLSEIVHPETNTNTAAGCSHYKRKAKFVASVISFKAIIDIA